MADTLGRTAYGASHDDETVWGGETRESAIASAVEHWLDDVDTGDIDPPDSWPHTLKLTLYTGLEWCTGPAEGVEDCSCGMWHDDEAPWLLQSWDSKETITEEVDE